MSMANTTRHLARKAGVCAAVLGVAMSWVPVHAAELTIGEGVVVKFGADAQLLVRDKLTTGSGVTLTSVKDDAAGGPTSAALQTAAAGDWRGLRIEKSANAFGSLSLASVRVRFGTTGLSIRGVNATLQAPTFADNLTGLRLNGAASPAITAASFVRNGTGLDADENSAPTIAGSQFTGNTTLALQNRTPATVIQATGAWWGHPSGPRDAVANPQGQGDAVSTGVNYGNFLASAPLINPSVRLALPAPYFEQRTVALDVTCTNASEYRVAEGTAFAGIAFQPLVDGRAAVSFTVSDGDGIKAITLQCRDATGTQVSASLSGGVLIDTQAPQVSITNPAAGSVLSAPITVEATASDASGIARVDFFLDGGLAISRTAAPYSYAWNTDASAEGPHTLRVVAVDGAGRSGEQTRSVNVSRAAVVPDTQGPVLANAVLGSSALANGATLTRNTTLTVDASDRSGVSRIDVLVGGVLLTTASGSGSYSASISIATLANGPHTLTLRATDSLNNVSSTNYSINVLHAAPDAPVVTSPSAGAITRTAAQAVSGTAVPNANVQLLLNGTATGAPIATASDGRFSGAVTLVPGANQIQATAADQWGTSAASAALQVTLDVTVPANPSALTATAQAQGKVRLAWTRSTDVNVTGYNLYRAAFAFTAIGEALKVNAAPLSAATSTYDDLPPQDGAWYWRVVAVNAAGTPSVPSNQVQATTDGTLPKALSVAYAPQGKVDAATGRVGQGRVDVVVITSEALQAIPYLALVPQGGVPITVALTKTGATTYAGNFIIDANTPSGLANALFSARDLVGNRGTDIDAGATLRIDTEGPALASIVVAPTSPIKNDATPTLQATFTFSKAPKAGSTPQLKYLLSGPVRSPITLTSLAVVNATTWSASFQLPADAGLGGAETFAFSAQAIDDLDNVSTKVTAFNRFQVYQGSLPPLAAPLSFTAKAQPGGKVALSWQAVADAASYQLYRQAPGQTDLTPLVRATGASAIDQTPQDGAYRYAVASVRQSNGQEAVSGQSAAVDVVSSANAPGAPQGLALQLTGQGIVATWQAPLASTVASYNLYRATGTSINSISGLTPLKTGIKQTAALDANPSPTQGAYVVTALDAAGNESALSNSAYLNASLLPVRNLRVEQTGSNLPVVSWSAPNGNFAGYNLYIGPEATKTKVNASLLTGTSFTDNGYTSGERRYTVATVDANGVEMPRSIVLPALNTQVASGLPLLRGVMNKLQLQVSNTSSTPLVDLRAIVRLPIDAAGTQFVDHKSDAITLGANQTRLLPVIVGGYPELGGQVTAQVGVEIAAADDDGQ
jgi:large repetitive protein